MSDSKLSIVVIDENPVRAAILMDGLAESGHTHVVHIDNVDNLLKKIFAIDPDVILIDLENPSRDTLEQMFQVSREVRRPTAVFVDETDRAMTDAAIDAGVSAYIVDGLKKERVNQVVDLTISRFNAFSRLQAELNEAKTALSERKIIERAKGILMRNHGMSEEEAYAALRKTAMNEKKRIVDIANSLVTADRIAS
ncbi:MAG: two-component system response regulator [Rhodospirillales bacterium CG15_BIG_FIL_POST_REV_8_21_14_020_66_15]|nr:MAG: two-component system response regulator [Rhodospirillales bacterium CG15_BIG_FIL_POST_REV_8_21_14_020_66_15]